MLVKDIGLTVDRIRLLSNSTTHWLNLCSWPLSQLSSQKRTTSSPPPRAIMSIKQILFISPEHSAHHTDPVIILYISFNCPQVQCKYLELCSLFSPTIKIGMAPVEIFVFPKIIFTEIISFQRVNFNKGAILH